METSRRNIIGVLALAPIATVVHPAANSGVMMNPAAEYLACEKALNQGHATEEEFHSSLLRMDQWQPADAEEFLFKFRAMCGDQPENDGMPTAYRMLLLAQQARRI